VIELLVTIHYREHAHLVTDDRVDFWLREAQDARIARRTLPAVSDAGSHTDGMPAADSTRSRAIARRSSHGARR
jgi:hypothetical protein